jgi:hypothetical protein
MGADIALEGAGLEGAPDGDGEFVHVEGLGDVIEGAELHGFHGGVDRGVGGDDDDGDLGAALGFLLDRAEDAEPVRVRQLHVEKHEFRSFAVKGLEGGLAILGFGDGVAFARKALFERPADEFLIVDDKDIHGGTVNRVGPVMQGKCRHKHAEIWGMGHS